MIGPERIVTFSSPGLDVARELGRVEASAAVRAGPLTAAWRGIRAVLGLVPPDVLTDAERARRLCVEALRRRAELLGATAVVGVRFDAVVATDGTTHLHAAGIAVVLAGDPA